jgi:hypothetical protein
MGDALLAARDICVDNRMPEAACQKFIRTANRLKNFHGQRPIMVDAESTLINLASVLEKAGFANPKYALPDELKSSYIIVRSALIELKPTLTAAYKYVCEKEIIWPLPARMESSARIDYNDRLIETTIVISHTGRKYYKDADGKYYVKSWLGYKRFQTLGDALDYAGDLP